LSIKIHGSLVQHKHSS